MSGPASGHRVKKSAFEAFEEDLQAALPRLYDADFEPTGTLWSVVGLDPEQGVGPLQSAILQAIEDLRPAPDTPASSILRRVYDLLHRRFVLKLTQDQVAEHLDMSVRHLRRTQRDSVHLLARRLWEHGPAGSPIPHLDSAAAEAQPKEAAKDDTLSAQWLTQVQEELASLSKSAPGAYADVGESMRSVREVAAALTTRHGISLDVRRVPRRTLARIHPSALRQILVAATTALTHTMDGGGIALRAERQEDTVRIVATASPGEAVGDGDLSLIREILTAHGGSVSVTTDDRSLSIVVELPAAPAAEEQARVLVVDDNTDLVRSYQFYAAGTRYELVHASEGRRVLETAEEISPDAIVLDIMLPDVDGWELLVQLHAHPATQSIPVVVCSVVQEEELALALGAALFLPKPARRQEFLAALDQVLSQAASGGPGSLGNKPAVC